MDYTDDCVCCEYLEKCRNCEVVDCPWSIVDDIYNIIIGNI